MIGILDYGMGNLRSVQKAFDLLGGPRSVVVTKPDDVAGCEKVVLPGVGNFADGMQAASRPRVCRARPRLHRHRPSAAGHLHGHAVAFHGFGRDAPEDKPVPRPRCRARPGRAVRRRPRARSAPAQSPAHGVEQARFHPGQPAQCRARRRHLVYLGHGYYCVPDDPAVTAATADYGQPFCAALHHKNLWATQFHPEKSQRVGLKILENFAAL